MKSVAAAILVGLFIGVSGIHMVRTDAAISLQEIPNKKSANKYVGPIVDYDLEVQTEVDADPRKRKLRAARGRRYNNNAPAPLAELPPHWVGFATGTDWYIGLPGLPVDRSDAVITGEVVASEAHLSGDRTGVYSEFSIRVDQILLNHLDSALKMGEVTIGEREGGVVRFRSYRLFEYEVYHQGMPRLGKTYLFFLIRNKEGEDYIIVTAYELHHGKVVPLDDIPLSASFQGTDEQEFLIKVRAETALRPARPDKERKKKK